MSSVSDTEDGWGLLENAACSDEEQQQTPDLQWQISGANGLQSQIRLNKGSIRSLANHVNALENNRINALETNVEQVERENRERFEQQWDDVDALERNVEALKKMNNDQFWRTIDRVIALEANFDRLERESTSRMDRLEHQNRTLQDGLDQTKKIIEQLHKRIEDALARMDTDFSGLEQRVKRLESSIRNGGSEYAITQENRLRNLEARVDWLQSNSYANPNNQYLYAPYKTAYIMPFIWE
jgi:predicted RNase H-like nuclease (RuvC/YqgF family)